MSRKFFDMGARSTEWDLFFRWPYRSGKDPVEWPKWLTCPVHYQERSRVSKDFEFVLIPAKPGKSIVAFDEMSEFTPEQWNYLIERINSKERQMVDDRPDAFLADTGEQKRVEITQGEGAAHDSVIIDTFGLSVRDTNNLVRFLYSNGWISQTLNPGINPLLMEMITWLEARGIMVSLNMEEM